jgi:hypothetical protein
MFGNTVRGNAVYQFRYPTFLCEIVVVRYISTRLRMTRGVPYGRVLSQRLGTRYQVPATVPVPVPGTCMITYANWTGRLRNVFMQSIYNRTNQNSVMNSDTRKYGHVYCSKYYEYMTDVDFGTIVIFCERSLLEGSRGKCVDKMRRWIIACDPRQPYTPRTPQNAPSLSTHFASKCVESSKCADVRSGSV